MRQAGWRGARCLRAGRAWGASSRGSAPQPAATAPELPRFRHSGRGPQAPAAVDDAGLRQLEPRSFLPGPRRAFAAAGREASAGRIPGAVGTRGAPSPPQPPPRRPRPFASLEAFPEPEVRPGWLRQRPWPAAPGRWRGLCGGPGDSRPPPASRNTLGKGASSFVPGAHFPAHRARTARVALAVTDILLPQPPQGWD